MVRLLTLSVGKYYDIIFFFQPTLSDIPLAFSIYCPWHNYHTVYGKHDRATFLLDYFILYIIYWRIYFVAHNKMFSYTNMENIIEHISMSTQYEYVWKIQKNSCFFILTLIYWIRGRHYLILGRTGPFSEFVSTPTIFFKLMNNIYITWYIAALFLSIFLVCIIFSTFWKLRLHN